MMILLLEAEDGIASNSVVRNSELLSVKEVSCCIECLWSTVWCWSVDNCPVVRLFWEGYTEGNIHEFWAEFLWDG